jgi:hypothetical protein
MIAWIGVGFALISSILFSCAAICLRREREKEEAVNMQYLMPGTFRRSFLRILWTCIYVHDSCNDDLKKNFTILFPPCEPSCIGKTTREKQHNTKE